MVNAEEFREKYGPWAVVTGASSGIGEEFARQIATLGINVVIVARREDRLIKLAEILREQCSVQVRTAVADLSNADGVAAVATATEDVDVGLLVNNAGVTLNGSYFAHNADSIAALLYLNVTAPALLAHTLGKPMMRRGQGGVLFVGSLSSSGWPWLSAYSSSKSFIYALAMTLRDEFNRSGVDCMVLEPGFVRSEMTAGMEGKAPMPFMYEAADCVREGLDAFGHSASFTPGIGNRIMRGAYNMLPHTLSIRLLSIFTLQQMGPSIAKFE